MLRPVNGSEIALVMLAVAFVLLGLAVVVALRSLTSSVEELRAEVAGAATVEDLRAAVASAIDPPAEVEPERPVTRVPTMFRSPGVIKAMALGTGTASAARRLRGGSNGNGKGH
jgi:hypothetical protein